MRRLDGGLKGSWPPFGLPFIGPRNTTAGIPWTFDDIPPDVRVGEWNAARAQITSGRIERIPNLWPSAGPDMVQDQAALQPDLATVDGFPAINFPDGTSNKYLVMDRYAEVRWWLFVLRHRSGVETVAATTTYLLSNGWAGGTGNITRYRARIRIDAGASVLATEGTWTSLASVNAKPPSASILPLPRSLVTLGDAANAGGDTSYRLGLGRSPGAFENSWCGPMWTALGLSQEPTGDLLARIEGRAAWDYNLQGSLPATHAFRNVPPTKEVG